MNNDKIESLKAYVLKTEQQLAKSTQPHMQAFLQREIVRTKAKIEYMTLGGK